jgi:hypothetical protein
MYNSNIPFEVYLRSSLPSLPFLFSIRHYKSLLPPSIPNLPIHLDHHQWNRFWSLSIPLTARTTWYRALHHKLPTRRMLHKHNPIQFFSPTCSICCSADEDDTYFLFLCPLKLQVWSQILSLYVNSMTSYVPNDLIHILQSLLHIKPVTDFRDPSLPFPSLSTVQIFACTLQSSDKPIGALYTMTLLSFPQL